MILDHLEPLCTIPDHSRAVKTIMDDSWWRKFYVNFIKVNRMILFVENKTKDDVTNSVNFTTSSDEPFSTLEQIKHKNLLCLLT